MEARNLRGRKTLSFWILRRSVDRTVGNSYSSVSGSFVEAPGGQNELHPGAGNPGSAFNRMLISQGLSFLVCTEARWKRYLSHGGSDECGMSVNLWPKTINAGGFPEPLWSTVRVLPVALSLSLSSPADSACPQLCANEGFSSGGIDYNVVAYPHFASPCVWLIATEFMPQINNWSFSHLPCLRRRAAAIYHSRRHLNERHLQIIIAHVTFVYAQEHNLLLNGAKISTKEMILPRGRTLRLHYMHAAVFKILIIL